MAAFPGSADPLNTPRPVVLEHAEPSPLPVPIVHEHAAPYFLFPTKGSNNLAHASSVIPKHVPLHLLQQITNGFSKDRLLGEGAYGKVYKGIFKTGEMIAVKLFRSKPGHDQKQFEMEFHNLTRLQHRNVVRMVGFCHETRRECVMHEGKLIFAEVTHIALCFEYMHYGSLSNYLFDENSGHDWPKRYSIIKGICEGLKYLHEGSETPIYHLDLKPANILLDDNMLPKLADFGLSRLFGEEQTRITESPIGTIGYLPPEYFESNKISNKLDIFSLGVIIIKIISGPTFYNQCYGMPPKEFIELVHGKWRSRLQATLVEPMEPYSEQIKGCIEMALSCLEKDRHTRPCIGKIVDKLNKMEGNDQGSSDQVLSVDICSTPAEASLPPAASYTPQERTNKKGVSRLREHVQYVMDDLVIGLAKSVVAGALTKVQSATEEADKLPQRAQRDLVFITRELQMMQSLPFLNVADEERSKNIVVRPWARQMRELAYDLEECIEFVVNMDRLNMFLILFYLEMEFLSFFLPLCMQFPRRPQYMAADVIKNLKKRVEEVNRRKPVLALQQSAPGAAVGYDTTRQHVLGDLTQLITMKDDPDLQVIAVWGESGGIGTTSIIRKSYSDPEISYRFTCRAWVNLTHPFNPHEFVRSLMAHFYANRYQERQGEIIGINVLTSMSGNANQGDLLSQFVQIVDKNNYLVVLENLSTMADWDSIRTFLPDRKNGSSIIVSSQQYEIASLCVGYPCKILDLKQLPAERSVRVFLREGSQYIGDKSEASNGTMWTSSNGLSTEYDPSHNQMNGLSSFLGIPNSRKKAARDWMQNSPLVGCRLKMNHLRYYTAQAQMNHSKVMSVWGIPGVGKSALIRNLYYDRILENQQFQEYGWVSLSHTQPFNLRDFSRRLLLDFQSESLQAKETAPARSMVGIRNTVQKCCELLSTRRCLVIIDGLQSTEEWDSIESSLVSRHSRSKTVIIVVTTEASVATYCADKEELVYNVKALEADAAFDLLKNEVSKKTPFPASLSNRENAVLRELVSVCGGLPLIIVAMAGVLAINIFGWIDAGSSISLRFMQEVETNPEFDNLWDVFTWMHSCFRTCPDSVKPCIFSLSFFPRDHNIRRRRLVRRWIAEDYSRDSNNKSAEENGEDFFSKLLNLSIIQQPPQSDTTVFSDVRMVSCQVNGFLRECIISRGMEENIVIELTGTCSPTTQRSGRHLVISESWNRDRTVLEGIDFSRLRSMTVFGNWESFFITYSMKLLQVLDLEDTVGVTDSDVEWMVRLLPRLKFLSLRGCHGIFHLPGSLDYLKQLQTLDVKNTSITTLPATITRLHKLQYIRAGSTTIAAEVPSAQLTSMSWLSKFHRRPLHLAGVEVPNGIRKLTALHTLGVVNIGASEGRAVLKMLKNLTQLRKLGVFGVNRKNSEAFSSAISSHGHLGSLSMWLDNESGGCLDDICLPSESLQSLKMYGLFDRLPGLQVNELSKLAKLHLEMATLRVEVIEFLGKLPKLCILRLCVKVLEDDQVHFHIFSNGLEEPSYQKLKVLDIACRSSLHVTFGSETMKKLELLKVECCSGLSYRLSGLDHLSGLTEVWLTGSYEEALKQFLQGQLAGHPRKPELKLEEEIPRSSTHSFHVSGTAGSSRDGNEGRGSWLPLNRKRQGYTALSQPPPHALL